MQPSVEIRVVHTPEQRVAGKRLGRRVEHDERSRGFAYPKQAWPTKSVQHHRRVPIFDQGDLGACTANAGLGCLGTEPYYGTVAADDVMFTEDTAVELYERATHLDHYPGHYPPEDTGSSGNAVAKALRERHLVKGWRWAFSLRACLAALAERPVIIGVNWYAGMDDPGKDGLVRVAGEVRGGHEFVLDGIEVNGERGDLYANRVWASNSWGEGWGKQGRFTFTYADLDRLLREDGDVTIFEEVGE